MPAAELQSADGSKEENALVALIYCTNNAIHLTLVIIT